MNLPYGIVDFARLRQEGYFYADKTRFIPLLEDPRWGRSYVIFLRPRRFGKTTFLSLLEHYYDVARKDRFESLFAGLYIGSHPTPERGRYLVLRLDFSGLGLDQGVDALRTAMLQSLRGQLRKFFSQYAGLLPRLSETWLTLENEAQAPAELMGTFLDLLTSAPHPLYILIDEYDRLVNDLIARGDHDAYKKVLSASGFIRLFYERIKAGTASVVRRIFITGVSPAMLNDLASGFNMVKSISMLSDFHDLCGFSPTEVEALVDMALASSAYTLPREQILSDMRRYYNGYLFSERGTGRLYNPDAVLYFLSELRPPAQYPRTLLDQNLRTDPEKLYTLLFSREGVPRQKPMEIIQALLTQGSVLGQLHDLFPLIQAYDERFFASYLYYLGLVTIGSAELDQIRFDIPNLVIRELHGATLKYILETGPKITLDEDAVKGAISQMARDGALRPFLELIDSRVLKQLSNRDLIRLDERGLKMLMLAYLSMSALYLSFSELELNRGYSDLILILNRAFPEARYSFLIELKYIKGDSQAKKALLEAAEAKFTEAEEQLRRYLEDERLAGVRGPAGWKAYSVVQIGTEAMLCRELGQPTTVLRWDRRRAAPQKKRRGR